MRSLYLCYFPLDEPLVETQVLAYLRGLAEAGHEMHLLTWEVRHHGRNEKRTITERLAADGIRWHRRRYHKRPTLVATAWDVAVGAFAAAWITRRHRIDVLHARTHVPAVMAMPARALGASLLFDIRGLVAEEYVDAGNLARGSLGYRLLDWVQRRALSVAGGVVVLTERARAMLFDQANVTRSGAPVRVIPSCVDVDAIAGAAPRRDEVRTRLGLDGATVLIYVGKFSTWYMAAEMARFAAVAREADPSLRFLVLTQSDPALLLDELEDAGLPREAVVVTRCEPAEVGAHLAAADFAISFIRDSPSKIASSPTKVGEYLAAGLPIVVSAGVGDTDATLEAHGVGVVVRSHDDRSYRDAYVALRAMADDPTLRERARHVAEDELSLRHVGVPRYIDLYDEMQRRDHH